MLFRSTSSEEVIINIENVINKIADIEEKEKETDSKLNEYLKTLGFVSLVICLKVGKKSLLKK